MKQEEHQKITSSHLKRNVYLYIRQSTMRQVYENKESTKRQYALRDRAIAFGWAFDQVISIDEDLGRSGASACNRKGFRTFGRGSWDGKSRVGYGSGSFSIGEEFGRLASLAGDLRVDRNSFA